MIDHLTFFILLYLTFRHFASVFYDSPEQKPALIGIIQPTPFLIFVFFVFLIFPEMDAHLIVD